jgi:hypothetical protein
VDHHGAGFGASCYELWDCATTDLPAFAQRYVAAAEPIAGLGWMSVGGGPGTQQIMTAWTQLGQDLRQAIATSVDNIYSACDALTVIAERYADSDTAAGRRFRDQRDHELGKPAKDLPHARYTDPSTRPRISLPDADQF